MLCPRRRRWFASAWALLLLTSAAAHANLLRNGAFQDDWLTLLPENQNHHWCYATGFQNRRDYNPDTWFLSGSWRWLNADGPRGTRRLFLEAPRAEATQRVNWVLVHDERKLEGFPDAGGFPSHSPQRSAAPLSIVRDLTLRVRLRGENVPENAGAIEVGFAPPGAISSADPLGTRTALTASASRPIPSGTFAWQWVEVTLKAAEWLKAARAAEPNRPDTALPGLASVAIRYAGSTGKVEIERAELNAAEPNGRDLLAQGGFERLDDRGWPEGWSQPSKYRYFPPGLYYIFNTWHNAGAANRGTVAPDDLLPHRGNRSLRMIVPSGDEVRVVSEPIVVNQTDAGLIEVSAWVKTDQLNMLQIDAISDTDERLPGFNFIHKAPVSIGSDEWRRIRQVFKPRAPLRSIRLVLAARGVNGYTLGDTGETPQANATGTVWWDDVAVFEPETDTPALKQRGIVNANADATTAAKPHLQALDPGERLIGSNVLNATVVNGHASRALSLIWRYTTLDGKTVEARSPSRKFAANESAAIGVPYEIAPSKTRAYTEQKGELRLVDAAGTLVAASEIWFNAWSQPIDLELGALYLSPDRRQFVRMNLGFSSATMKTVSAVRLDVVRRGSGAVIRSTTLAAKSENIAAQRDRIPAALREDFTNLLLADLDVSDLPVQPHGAPERNWLIRASVIDIQGRVLASQDSEPFCRQAHRADQPAVEFVRVDKTNLLYVNDKPFLPWGPIYGHVPVYDGSRGSDTGPFRDLRNLPAWGIYDGFTSATYARASSDFNSTRYTAGAVLDATKLERAWKVENQIAATAFLVKQPAFSLEELKTFAGGESALSANLAFIRRAPMVVSTAPGIEEAFGLFHSLKADQLTGLREVVDSIRAATQKPVMLGHGGYWNRFEFERVPFFDIYDPETEPLYPANLHTDLMPLIVGQPKTIWLRPQMYEDVPYERWRFHTYVELMRGARGFQLAHGPGDASLFRGLGGELDGLKPVLWSTDPGPAVRITPAIEHWSRKSDGRTFVIAATTHALTFGSWKWADGLPGPHGRARVTEHATAADNESNAYGIGGGASSGPRLHGLQYLPEPRRYPTGSRLVQWVWLDPKDPPRNLTIVVKGDGRFTHGASWGDVDQASWRGKNLEWFLRAFYRHATGFLGWGKPQLAESIDYAPRSTRTMAGLPVVGAWTRLEVPLDDIDAVDKLIDGVGFVHDDGRVLWGDTSIVSSSGETTRIWGDLLGPTPAQLMRTRVDVAGLKAGTRVRVLFEDREITASAGYFIDDFRGRDLYQRFGGGRDTGYGDAPVALHLYEIPD